MSISLLTQLSKQSKYLIWYVSLVSKQYDATGYTEKHHILPKSLGGTNEKDNLVRLPARVHFICHKLLVRMVIDTRHKKNMIHALNMLAKANNKDQNRYKISSKEYETIRSQLSDSMKGTNNPMYGKPAPNRGVTHTKETRDKLSAANIKFHADHVSPRLGFKATEETKLKQKKPKSAEAKLNMSIAAKKKPRMQCVHCGGSFTKSNHTRFHGVKCKMNITLQQHLLQQASSHTVDET